MRRGELRRDDCRQALREVGSYEVAVRAVAVEHAEQAALWVAAEARVASERVLVGPHAGVVAAGEADGGQAFKRQLRHIAQ